jgi:hypothetical protein
LQLREYDLYLPLHYNDGRRIESAKLDRFKRRLIDHFGGLTHFPQENEGIWRFGGFTFRDRVVILRVLSGQPAEARQFFSEFKVELQRDLEQTDVLIVERALDVVT